MNTLAKLVDNTIQQLEQQNRPRPAWTSDAERKGLPTVNEHDNKGAPLLNRDEVLRRSLPDCVGLR